VKLRSHVIFNKRLFGIFALTFILTVIISSSLAYEPNPLDAYWNRPPYPHLYYINGCSVPNDILAVNDAARDWTSIATPNHPYLHQYWPPPHQIYVRNVQVNDIWDGMCIIYDYNNDDYLDFADIYINYHWTWNYSRQKVRSVAGHEFGHSLGLWDEWDEQCLEYPVTSTRFDQWGIFKPTQDEIDGINDYYGD